MPDDSDPVRAVIDTPSCPVCKDHYEPTRKPRMFVECGHDSCTQCIIDMKAAGRHRCPMCNVPVKMEPNLPIMWSIIGSGPSSRVPETLRPGIKVESDCGRCWTTVMILLMGFATIGALLALMEYDASSKRATLGSHYAECGPDGLPVDDSGVCWQTRPSKAAANSNPKNLCHTAPPLTTTRIIDKQCVDTLSPSLKLSILQWYYLVQMDPALNARNYTPGMERHYCFWEVVGTRLNERRLEPTWANTVRAAILERFEAARDAEAQGRFPGAVCLIKILVNEVERRASWLQYKVNCAHFAFTQNYPREPQIRLDQHPFRAISGEYFSRVYNQCAQINKRLDAIIAERQAQIDEYKAPHCSLIA